MVVGDGGKEEGALRGGSLRDCHLGSLWVVVMNTLKS
jgi:hypothetical protein